MHNANVNSGLSTGIYTTNSVQTCKYVAQNGRCEVLVVENAVHASKFMELGRHQLPHLKAIVQYRDCNQSILEPVNDDHFPLYSVSTRSLRTLE
jgi:hypothetical protein